jgi:hypothetical protein
MCLDSDGGDLGVSRVREFNLSLFGKWCWWTKRGWFKVLIAKYGLSDGRVRRGGRKTSLWWKDLYDFFFEKAKMIYIYIYINNHKNK